MPPDKEKNPFSRGYVNTFTELLEGFTRKYKEICIGFSIGVFAAVADLFLGAIEDGEPLLAHIARHGPTSLHMVQHYFFVIGSMVMGYLWWHTGSEYRKLNAMMAELEESETKYKDIFDNVGDMICVIDPEGNITEANRRLEDILGYSREKLLQMNIKELLGPGSLKSLDRIKKRIESDGKVLGTEIEFISKSRKHGFGELHCTAKYKGDTLEQIRCIIIDITERKHAEEEMTKKLMKYRIERGRAYLVKEKKLDLSVDIFLDLLSSGWRGAAISRNPPQILKEACSEKTPLLELGEGDGMFPPKIPELKTAIEDELFENDVVLLDRLDYLITKNGFEAVLKFLQKLSELFYTEKRVLLLSLDPATLDTRELAILEKETAPPAPKHHLAIPHDLYSVLKFVYSENRGGKMPSYREIGSNFGITKPTTRKRIGELRSRGYLMELKRGRSKVLELTEKGKELF